MFTAKDLGYPSQMLDTTEITIPDDEELSHYDKVETEEGTVKLVDNTSILKYILVFIGIFILLAWFGIINPDHYL